MHLSYATFPARGMRAPSAMLALFGLAVLFAAAGCGSEVNTDGRLAINGNITLDGAPVQSGSIRFEPEGGQTASGATIAEGKYEIPADKGLKPGKYRVFINATEPDAEQRSAEDLMNNPGPPKKELIPAKYNKKSDVTVEVTEAGPNQFDFPIASK